MEIFLMRSSAFLAAHQRTEARPTSSCSRTLQACAGKHLRAAPPASAPRPRLYHSFSLLSDEQREYLPIFGCVPRIVVLTISLSRQLWLNSIIDTEVARAGRCLQIFYMRKANYIYLSMSPFKFPQGLHYTITMLQSLQPTPGATQSRNSDARMSTADLK